MTDIGTLAVWLTVVMGAWAAALRFAGAARDARLAASAERALHATAALMAIAVGTLVAGLIQTPDRAIAVVTALWSGAESRLAVWALALSLGAAVLPWLDRKRGLAPRVHGASLAGGIVGIVALLIVLVPWLLTDTAEHERLAVETYHPAGILAHATALLGYAALLVSVAMWHSGQGARTARRAGRVALALTTASLALAAWSRYSGVSAADVLPAAPDASWPEWHLVDVLPVVPLLLLAGFLYGSTASWARRLMRTLAALLALAIVLPPAASWVQGREPSEGLALTPPRISMIALPVLLAALAVAWRHARVRMPQLTTPRLVAAVAAGGVSAPALAAAAGVRGWPWLVCAAAAGALAALLGTMAAGSRAPAQRLAFAAQAAAALIAIGALSAISTRPQLLEIAPGQRAAFATPAGTWRIANQGVSHDESPTFDGSVVGLDIAGPGDGIALPGERLYRDADGHASVRAVIPAVHRGLLGDLRLTAPGLRGEAALIRVRHHPLTLLAWVGAALLCACVAASVFVKGETGRRE